MHHFESQPERDGKPKNPIVARPSAPVTEILWKPLRYQAADRLGLSTSALSSNAMQPSRSPPKWPSDDRLW
jgi:hypothetical protein